jgi:phosphatidylserine decarboxylase
MRFRTLWEGRSIFAVILIMASVALWLFPPLFPPMLLAFFGTVGFFRDPRRRIPPETDAVVAPADGRVTHVEIADEPEMPTGRARRISIFLSVFDVHVNRAPTDGEVVRVVHEPGSFLDARHADAGAKNERQTWTLRNGEAVVVVRQITGAIARRIVAWAKPGDRLAKGDRIGMIRFGSRTDLFLPLEAEVVVRPGDRVRGGSSVVARLAAGRHGSGG